MIVIKSQENKRGREEDLQKQIQNNQQNGNTKYQ